MATSLADEKEEPKIEKFEVVKTIIELPTIPVQNMISSGQVQTSVNGIVVQNGLATNQVLCRSQFVFEFYGEEIPSYYRAWIFQYIKKNKVYHCIAFRVYLFHVCI